MNSAHLVDLVIRPTLRALEPAVPFSEAAVEMVYYTAAAESGLDALTQLGGGPARGIYQMEPATHDDIWENYLAFRTGLRAAVQRLLAPVPAHVDQLVTNLAYATAMCRVHYRRVPAALPPAGDLDAHARYWKDHYNTAGGAGTLAHFKEAARAAGILTA